MTNMAGIHDKRGACRLRKYRETDCGFGIMEGREREKEWAWERERGAEKEREAVLSTDTVSCCCLFKLSGSSHHDWSEREGETEGEKESESRFWQPPEPLDKLLLLATHIGQCVRGRGEETERVCRVRVRKRVREREREEEDDCVSVCELQGLHIKAEGTSVLQTQAVVTDRRRRRRRDGGSGGSLNTLDQPSPRQHKLPWGRESHGPAILLFIVPCLLLPLLLLLMDGILLLAGKTERYGRM